MSRTQRVAPGEWPGEVRLLLAFFVVLTVVLFGMTVASIGSAWAGPGEYFPGPTALRERLTGPAVPPQSKVERLLATAEGPFNGHGTMRPAFSTRSRDWDRATDGLSPGALRKLTDEREGECLAVLSWVRSGADRAAYESDSFPEPAEFVGQPISHEWKTERGGIRIRSLIAARCVDCHEENGRVDRARAIPLDTYVRLQPYVTTQIVARMTGTDWIRLCVRHGFGILACLTGTGLVTMTARIPRGIKFAFASGPLIAVVVTVLCCGLSPYADAFVWGAFGGGIAAGVGLLGQLIVGLRELVRPTSAGQSAKRDGPTS